MKEKIEKTKTKARKKIAAKIGKAAKSAAKAASVVALMLAMAGGIVGCASTGAMPARSQAMHNDFRDCIFNIGKTLADDGSPFGGELFTQTQANEGSETISPTATPTNTTDLDTDISIPLNKSTTRTASETVNNAAGAAES